MYSIQLVIIDGEGPGRHKVVETLMTSRFFLYDAEHRGKLALKQAKRRPSDGPLPNGYMVLDGDGEVVARSWEPVKLGGDSKDRDK